MHLFLPEITQTFYDVYMWICYCVYNMSFLVCEVYFCIVVGTLIKEFIMFLSSDAASHLVSHLLSSSIKSTCSG